MTNPFGFLRLLYRFPLALLHALIGTPLAVFCQAGPFRKMRPGKLPFNQAMSVWWADVTCRIFGLKHRVTGEFRPGAQLVVANHISWIDVHVLHSLYPVGFVAKAEIGEWPVMGWVARAGGTVFHQRGSHNSSRGATTAMADRLREGGAVAIFPEGGILPGEGVKHFHARLFAAAIDADAPVQPVTIRYLRGGERYDDITFLPGENMAANFFRLLMQKNCIADVHVLPPIKPEGKQRRQLAGEAESAVRGAFESELPDE
jgi:1-acyl-sn-glycerol-3-phosphate acyltransferase